MKIQKTLKTALAGIANTTWLIFTLCTLWFLYNTVRPLL